MSTWVRPDGTPIYVIMGNLSANKTPAVRPWAARARFQHLTTRTDNPLHHGQVRAAIAAALLRQLFVVITRRVAWDPAIAGGTAGEVTPAAA